ncbi:TPA: ABC transporter ATP-binding protein [Streptococcus pneumoniae]
MFDKSTKFKLIFPIVIGIVGVILSLFIPINFKRLIDLISAGKGVSVEIITYILLLTFFQLLLNIVSGYYLQKIGILSIGNLRIRLINQILSFKKSYFDKVLSGDIASVLVNDSSALSYLLSSTIPSIVTSLISVFVIIFLLFYLSIKLSVVLLVLLPILGLMYLPLGRFLSKTSLQYQEELAMLNHYSHFITTENDFIKISSTEKIEATKGERIVSNLLSIGIKQAKIFAISSPLIMTAIIFGALSVITYGLVLVSSGSLTIGSFIAYITLFIQILSPLGSLGESYSHLKGIEGAAKRVLNVLSISDKEDKKGIENLSFMNLKFDNVNFSYDNEKLVLNGFDFVFKSGESIAIVGPSGSGKTTVLSLIENIYSVSNGKIFIDDKEISDISLDYLRYNVGYVSQKYPIISGTIRENLMYGIRNKNISDQELLEKAKLTNFFEVIVDLPAGLDTLIGDKGVLLSEGQKQRLAITRVLLLNPKILLLDEVTSALDSNSEKIIQDTLDKFGEDKIKITIAHRLSTVKNSNRILFLENGKITGIGSHEELYLNHGLYKMFVDNQLNDIKSIK